MNQLIKILYHHPSVLGSSDLDHSKKQVMGELMEMVEW